MSSAPDLHPIRTVSPTRSHPVCSCTAFCPNITSPFTLRRKGSERLLAALGGSLVGGGDNAPGTGLHHSKPDLADLDSVPDILDERLATGQAGWPERPCTTFSSHSNASWSPNLARMYNV